MSVWHLYAQAAAGDDTAQAAITRDVGIIKEVLVPAGVAGLAVTELLDRIRGRLDYELCGSYIGALISAGVAWVTGDAEGPDARVGLTALGLQL